MVEIRHLKLVDAIAEVGTLKKAAEKLYLTQSALSHQLKELETHLGTQVFYRINNQLHFTPAGKELLDAGKEVLKQLKTLEDRVRRIEQDQLKSYVHGYSQQEAKRLNDQATTISELLHWDSVWEEGSLILEAGCGVGSQTKIIAPNNPGCQFVSIDLSEKSLAKATEEVAQLDVQNVTFKQADVMELPFEDHHFDHVFVCFLLEHLSKPEDALLELKRVLKPGGSITVIEGDHGSTFFHPHSNTALKAVQAQITLQKQNGGDPNIGRALYPILREAGFEDVQVSPRPVYVDDAKPEMLNGFVKHTFTAMIQGVAEEAIAKKVISKNDLDKGVEDLLRTAEGNGTFCYTFFKATGFLSD
ncbi:MAG: methyltransferase domain-containing protein [Bacteroidota bacterium]